MTINKFRSILYALAKFLGDVQAGQQAHKRRSLRPIEQRLKRRLAGKITGRIIGRIGK
jgi:hypothetical protein